MATEMLASNAYSDSQGTVYSVTASDQPDNGTMLVTVYWRKAPLQIYCDQARMNDGKFQFNLPGSQLWMQMSFAPLSSKMVPA